jgi:hypothetical protein
MNVPFDLVSIDFDSIIAGRFCSGELGRVAYPVPLLLTARERPMAPPPRGMHRT